MKLDPKKADLAKLASCVKKLASFCAEGERNWAEDTAKTLAAGKLEDFDLDEYVSHVYETKLASTDDKRPVWDHSRALIALIDEMQAKGLRAAKAKKVAAALKGWSLEP